jgi:hypothetical protein
VGPRAAGNLQAAAADEERLASRLGAKWGRRYLQPAWLCRRLLPGLQGGAAGQAKRRHELGALVGFSPLDAQQPYAREGPSVQERGSVGRVRRARTVAERGLSHPVPRLPRYSLLPGNACRARTPPG